MHGEIRINAFIVWCFCTRTKSIDRSIIQFIQPVQQLTTQCLSVNPAVSKPVRKSPSSLLCKDNISDCDHCKATRMAALLFLCITRLVFNEKLPLSNNLAPPDRPLETSYFVSLILYSCPVPQVGLSVIFHCFSLSTIFIAICVSLSLSLLL
jgi:hypothetical protein